MQCSIVEVGPRDGLQNISGPPVPTETKLELIRRLFQSGVKVMEVGSFVRADKVPQVCPISDGRLMI
jgi:hydroxymethylglutaryl-CoA lyase